MEKSEILKLEDLQSRIAEAVSYTYLDKGEVLMVNNKGEFAKVEASKISGRKYQGWAECVCYEVLFDLLGDGDTSDDGLLEAEKIINYMKIQL